MLPPGLRFKPTDEELITYFLYKKVVAREPLMPPLDDFVPEFNSLFKTEPWLIWDQFGGPNLSRLDQDVYFFTQLELLSAKDGGGVRISHKIESGGTWSRSKTEDVEDDEGNIIGLKCHLRYENKGCENHGKWLLEEYSIAESSKIVLCRLKRREKPSEEFPKQTGKRKHSEYQLNLNEHEQQPSSNKAARTESGSSSAALQRPNLDDHDVIIIDDDDEESESPDQFGLNSSLDEWLASLDESQHWPPPAFGGIDEQEGLQNWSDDVPLMEDGFHSIGTKQLESPLFVELLPETAALGAAADDNWDVNPYCWSDSLFM